MNFRPPWLRMRSLPALILVGMLAACLPATPSAPQATLSISRGDTAMAAAAQQVVEAFLEAWEAEDYPAMYALLSPLSQDALTQDEFTAIYQEFATTLTLQSISTRVLSSLADSSRAEVAYRVDFETNLVGTFSRDSIATLTREQGRWRIQWEIGMLLPDLRGGDRLELVHQLPSRGRIFDRAGAPLAAYERALAIGVVPGEIRPEQAERVY